MLLSPWNDVSLQIYLLMCGDSFNWHCKGPGLYTWHMETKDTATSLTAQRTARSGHQ